MYVYERESMSVYERESMSVCERERALSKKDKAECVSLCVCVCVRAVREIGRGSCREGV